MRFTRLAAARAAATAAALLITLTTATTSASAQVAHPRSLTPITLGFSAGSNAYLASGSAAATAFWDPRAKSVGAQMIRLDVDWSSVAPATRPAGFDAANPSSAGYNWTKVDAAVRELSAAGFTVLITVQEAPSWAEGSGMPATAFAGAWEPNATALGQFAHAIAERYSGSYPDPLNVGSNLPQVRDWQVWDEPNLPEYLAPQWRRVGKRYVAVSPGLYRAMANAFYRNVKSVSRSNFVVLAGLGPYGDQPGTSPTDRLHPIAFLQLLLCVNGAGKRTAGCPATYFDAADSHTYGIYGPTWPGYWSDDLTVASVSRTNTVLQAAERIGTALPHGSKPSWVTEVSWDTNPPDPDGIPVAEQARWLEQSMYLFWKQHISTVLWWQIADSPEGAGWEYTYQAGVYFLSGQPKPSATAFRFPLISYRSSSRYVTVWSRSPASGVMSIQKLIGGSWRTIAQAQVSSHEVTQVRVSLTGKATLRGTIDGISSLSWVQGG